MDCIKNKDTQKYLTWDDGDKDYVDTDFDENGRFFITLKGDSFSDLKEGFLKVFSEKADSYVMNEYRNEIAFITKPNFESEIKEMLSNLKTAQSFKFLHTML